MVWRCDCIKLIQTQIIKNPLNALLSPLITFSKGTVAGTGRFEIRSWLAGYRWSVRLKSKPMGGLESPPIGQLGLLLFKKFPPLLFLLFKLPFCHEHYH